MATRSLVAVPLVLLLAVAPPARAFNNVSSYSANFDNFRYCASPSPALGTCDNSLARSPSQYYLESGATSSVLVNSNGTVKLRIDTLKLDTGLTFACQSLNTATCVSGVCQGAPRQGTVCSADAQCWGPACSGGPRDRMLCGTGLPACTSLDGSPGWALRFRGNAPAQQWSPSIQFLLLGSGDGLGCTKTCPFTLTNDSTPSVGSINSDGLSCTTSGDCGSIVGLVLPTNLQSVELVDPQGEVFGIPTLGTAGVVNNANTPDPAVFGDACRNQVPPPDDCP
jgi:hypothetical protein